MTDDNEFDNDLESNESDFEDVEYNALIVDAEDEFDENEDDYENMEYSSVTQNGDVYDMNISQPSLSRIKSNTTLVFDEVHNILENSSVTLKDYFGNRLQQVVSDLGGDFLDVNEWQTHVLRKSGGLTMGLLDVEYINSKARKFRSRVEVACFLGLMPSAKNIRSMTREQHYLCAMETRERHLISQQLALNDYKADAVRFENSLTILSHGEYEIVSVDKCFSFGNITVINWGRIVQDAAFHTSSQLYPLGFCCLRQEHDVVLDRVVDCLCEIDTVHDTVDEGQRRVLLPLFRITVSWCLDDGNKVHCVYEARTPQQAWQAAMLERVGLSSTCPSQSSTVEVCDKEGDSAFELPDEEESSLRVEVREQRRLYFRALRAEQSLGLQAAVKPRLSVEAVDSFGDELLLRLIEGMESSVACRSYQFLDSREREAGRKSMLRSYSRMFAHAKHLDKVLCRSVGGGMPAVSVSLGPRKRRPDDLDSRKRVRTEENKELRTLTTAFLKNRGVRLREVEKGVTLLKAAMARNVKKRRDDAKIVVEAVSEKEDRGRDDVTIVTANSMVAIDDGEALRSLIAELVKCGRPEPSAGPMLLDGEAVGPVLEVWEFLSTFSESLSLSWDNNVVPSVDSLLSAIRARDPAHKLLCTYTQSLQHTFEGAFSVVKERENASFLKDIPPSAAGEVLNSTGMTLCGVLVRDFERIMGLDQVEAQAGDLRVPLNELTWREMARVVLLSSLCKDVGMSDADISTTIKGRGFYTTPESADRKALKLARRRINFAFTIRDEYQESLFGFGSGQCVRLPAPSTPFRSEEVVWTELVASLTQVSDGKGWLIYEIIRAAAVAASAVDTSLAARRLQKALNDCIAPSVFRQGNAGASKRAALSILSSQFYRKHLPSTQSLNLGQEEQHDSSIACLLVPPAQEGKLRLSYDFSPHTTPMSSFDLWDKHALEAVRRAKPVASVEDCSMVVVSDYAGLVDEEEKMEKKIKEIPVQENEVPSASEDVDIITSGAIEDVDLEVEEHEDDQEGDYEEEVEWVAAPVEFDFSQAELLSVSMQRCYLVLRDLMTHAHARFFLRVDGEDLLVTAQPLTLQEIRAYLVSGEYKDSIFSFYCDVALLLENAMAVNFELSPGRVAAQKLQIVFERLFFETVLCWDHPLPFHDSCHACRSAHPISSNKIAVCDRCEGSYHLHCLNPPMLTPPRSEWYCLPCVEQRGIANAHPYKTADVVHPSDPEALGEVVGIEQLLETVLFVVEFGSLRELWTGRKVRQYAIDSASRDLMEGQIEQGQRRPLQLQLPTGYDIEDYDRVCGMARAYTGWGASRNLIPAFLLDAHSLTAREKATSDNMFDKYRRAATVLAAIGASCLVDEPTGAAEWSVVLRSLLQKALGSPQVSGMIALMDDSIDEAVTARLLTGVQTGRMSLAELKTLMSTNVTQDTPSAAAQGIGEDDDELSNSEDDMPASRRTSGRRARSLPFVEEEEAEFESDEAEFESDADSTFDKMSNIVEDEELQLVDSDDDNDEEEDFYDAQGVCLTSGVSERACAREEDWDVRLLSRQKGREDALLTQVLLRDVLSELDVEGRSEEAEEGYELVRNELGSFYKVAANCIVKACMGRPSESLVIDDWCVGWQNKMDSLLKDHQSLALNPDKVPILCGLCGSEESYLGSPFVRGVTWAEYDADLRARDVDATSDDTISVLTPVCASTGIKGFRARNKALNGLVWLPLDELDAKTEMRECARMKRLLKSGSMVVHECCADFMHFSRRLTQGRSQNSDNNHIVELLAGLGRAKTSPLGKDRLGDLYWVFAGSSMLFVSSSSSSNNSTMNPLSIETDEILKSCVWRVYSLSCEISALVRWLDSRLPFERLLSRTLSLLFPDAVKFVSNCSQDTLVPSDKFDVAEVTLNDHLPQVLPSVDICDIHAEPHHKDENEVDGEVVVEPPRKWDVTQDSETDDEDQNEEDLIQGQDEVYVRKSQRTRHNEPRINVRLESSYCLETSTVIAATAVLRRGEVVLVETNPLNRILWEARVLESRDVEGRSGLSMLYKVHFLHWDASYDGWFHEDCIMTAAEAAVTSRGAIRGGTIRSLMQESRSEFVREQVSKAPILLQSLTAFHFMGEVNRACGPSRTALTFSDSSSSDVAILRSAMLMIEMALPLGAVDEADDRWGDNFVIAWRQAVCACNDVTGLMQCQIMLEYGIRTAWLKPAGLKLFSCMPSRALCMRSATIGLVAMRVWLLDLTIRYDKTQSTSVDKIPSLKGRPIKTAPSVVAKSSGRSKGSNRSAFDDK